jgi:hypothetical protein
VREGGADLGPALLRFAVSLVFLDGEDVEVGGRCRTQAASGSLCRVRRGDLARTIGSTFTLLRTSAGRCRFAELLGEVRRIVALLCETPNIGEVAFSECGQCAESPRATKV